MRTATETEPERNKRHFQRTLFDGVAGLYDASRPGYPASVVEFVAATAGIGPGDAVLEIGCGTGQLTERLAELGVRLTAIDIGPALLDVARRRLAGAGVLFQVTSFEDLEADDASVDLVICSAAFHWIDPEVRFSKSARLLRPGGWLALLGNEDSYDEPLGSALTAMWRARTDTGGAWDKPPSEPDVIAATGLFDVPVTHDHAERIARPAADVIAVESTRATFLGWPAEERRAFTEEMREQLRSQPEVQLTRHTSVTMAQVPRNA
jgi:ubiquinone/menaquinone biosynthesis C-methylase UbiE